VTFWTTEVGWHFEYPKQADPSGRVDGVDNMRWLLTFRHMLLQSVEAVNGIFHTSNRLEPAWW
jgi:hypothetical protein